MYFSSYHVAILGIVVRNLLAVIAGPLLLNASFIALASSMRRRRRRCRCSAGVGEIPIRASRVS